MDRLPQEIYDHIVSYLAPCNLRLKNPYDRKQKKSIQTSPYLHSSTSSTSTSASSSTSSLSTIFTPSSSTRSNCDEHATRLAPLAIISRKWQRSIERLTFRHIRLCSDELSNFQQILTDSTAPSSTYPYSQEARQQQHRRRHLLKSLTLDIILPPYSRSASKRIETLAERQANDMAYTAAIQELFRILKMWEVEDPSLVVRSRGRSRKGLKLCINHPLSRSDKPYSLEGEWDNRSSLAGSDDDVESDESSSSTRLSIHEGRYFHHHIDLLSPSTLPELNSIGELVMKQPAGRWGFRMTYPKVPYLLAHKMPRLEALDIDVSDNEKRFPELRRRNRLELAAVMQGLELPRLKRAEMLFFQMRWRDQRVVPPVLLTMAGEGGKEVDPLSCAIRRLAGQGLTDLTVTGVVDQSLFRDCAAGENNGSGNAGASTNWKKMRRLEINFYETTPAGEWYFTGRPPHDALQPQFHPELWNNNEAEPIIARDVTELGQGFEQFSFAREAGLAGMEPRTVFRSTPCAETMTPLVDAFAEATAGMPNLKSAMLNCTTDVAEFNFAAGGEEERTRPDWFMLAYMEPATSTTATPRETVVQGHARAGVVREEEEEEEGVDRLSSHMTARRGRSTSQASAQRQLITSLMGWQPTKQLREKLTSVQPDCRAEVVVEKDMDTWLREQGQLPTLMV